MSRNLMRMVLIMAATAAYAQDDFGGWVVGIGEDYILTIASIHQLQHLLFGLGLNSEMEV